MNGWKEKLAAKKVLVADGACGTELAKRGLPPGTAPEQWNIDRPDEVRAVNASYVAAGAEILLTNTLGGTRLKLEKVGLADRTADVNRIAARLAREAAGKKAFVFASVGPTGEFLEPLGTLTESQMVEAFAEQVVALAEGGVEGFAVETFSDLLEAAAALRAIRENTKLPAAVTFTFEKGQRGYATMMGVTPEQAAKEMEAAGADIVGANCGGGMDQMVDVARLMRPVTKLPLWFKPNAGRPRLVNGRTVFPESPEESVARAPELLAAGAQIVGGCCGTTPEHIRRLVEAVRARG